MNSNALTEWFNEKPNQVFVIDYSAMFIEMILFSLVRFIAIKWGCFDNSKDFEALCLQQKTKSS